ncbi:MAG: sulfotransferase, partial [Anaerolineales bacterium]|nr:sulfotransferase [Anaerolineales bacterium]
ASVSWRKAVRQARAWDNSHDACYVEITYRNLLHNPEATLKKICQALNLDYAPSMLSPQRESAVDRSGDKSPRARYRSLDPSRQDRWRKKLTPLDVSIVEQACHREMAWWDYQPVNPPVPTAQIVSRQLQEITHYFYKQTGKTVKAYGRKLGWKLGYGALPLPQN